MMAEIDPIEEFIMEAFNENFEDIRRNTGHAISPHLRELALNQVLLYWRKMKEIAEKITETEVKLNLPNQKTPKGRKFAIEGVVDIVRANDQVVMYDIKTHDAEYVRAHPEEYGEQLNVYAHIWHHLRAQQLDETAIIATDYPITIREAMANRDAAALEKAIVAWDPLIKLPFKPENVQAMIEKFGKIVDKIEENIFAPAPLEKLKEKLATHGNSLFATSICRYCDARFSCSSYRQYITTGKGRIIEPYFKDYYGDLGPEAERDDWTTNTLDNAPEVDTLADII
jgi:hypothetical protein